MITIANDHFEDYFRLDTWEQDRAVLMLEDQWRWSGGVVYDPRKLRLSASASSTYSLPESFRVRFLIRSTDLADAAFQWKDASNNGYKVSFPSGTDVRISRLDSGSATEIDSADATVVGLADDAWFLLDVDRLENGIITVGINGQNLLCVDDDDHISATMKPGFVVGAGDFLDVVKGHLYKLFVDRAEYQRSLAWNDEFGLADTYLKPPFLTLTDAFSIKLLTTLFPEKGYCLKFNFAANITYQAMKIFLTTPDKTRGAYIEWFTDGSDKKIRICSADGTVKATGSGTTDRPNSINVFVDSATEDQYLRVENTSGTLLVHANMRNYLSRGLVLEIEGAETGSKTMTLYSVTTEIDGDNLAAVSAFSTLNSETISAVGKAVADPTRNK